MRSLSGADTIYTGAGLDFVSGEGNGDGVWVESLEDRDTLLGGGGADMLLTGEGADQVAGNGSDDHLEGGSGRDTLSGGASRDTSCMGLIRSMAVWVTSSPTSSREATRSTCLAWGVH